MLWWKLPNSSCHFPKPQVSFLKILHHSSVSCEITPLYFFRQTLYSLRKRNKSKCAFWRLSRVWVNIHKTLAIFETKLLCTFLIEILYTFINRALSEYKFGEISCEQSNVWNFTLWWTALSKWFKVLAISHDTEKWYKCKEKLTFGFKYDMRNLVNFQPATQKSENLTLISSFCPKYIKSELKVIFHDNEQCQKKWIASPYGFKNDMKNLVNFHWSTRTSEKLYLDELFCPKHIRFQLEN